MLTIKFNNHRTICINTIYINQLNQLFKDTHQYSESMDLLEQYSFVTWDRLREFVNQDILINVHQDNDLLMYSIKGFEYFLKILEPIFTHIRNFPILQIDIYPEYYIYTYTDIYEKDLDAFQEAPNGTYTWDNYPVELQTPYSNMQVQNYEFRTHIATIYHYFLL